LTFRTDRSRSTRSVPDAGPKEGLMRASTVRRLRPWVQALAFILFVVVLVAAGRVAFLPADLFFRLDPLAGLAALLAARRQAPAMLAGGLIALALAVIAGRAWCGWLCPLGTVLDWTPASWHPYDPSRRQFIAPAGAAVAGVGLAAIEPAAAHPQTFLVRPPGATDPDFLAQCVRCGICLKVCPTSGLQPGLTATGWGGIWTPVLVPRLGYCDFSCNACGQACPTVAIPRLSLLAADRLLLSRTRRTFDLRTANLREGKKRHG
jgi:ferredoxin